MWTALAFRSPPYHASNRSKKSWAGETTYFTPDILKICPLDRGGVNTIAARQKPPKSAPPEGLVVVTAGWLAR